MKKFIFLILSAILAISVAFDADARKKFGSSKKGKTYKTAQAQPKQAVNTNNPTLKKKSSSKKGLIGGILGGLLAGGLIAAMLGGDFEGMQILDMLMIAGVLFIAFKLFKGMMQKKAMQQQAPAGAPFDTNQQFKSAAPEQMHTTSAGFGQSDVPFNLPPGFDSSAFLQGARNHYHTLQKAWNENDFNTISEYVSEELCQQMKLDRAEIEHVNTEVMFVDAELVRAQTSPVLWEVSVSFKGKYRDLGDKVEEPILEVWHLERDATQADAPWLIVGIEDQAA